MVKNETLATTKTNSSGEFFATTETGYAQFIRVNSDNVKYWGTLEVDSDTEGPLAIAVRPSFATSDVRIFNREESQKQYALLAIATKIVHYHEKKGGAYLSLADYRQRNVISEEDYEFISENFDLFSFPTEPGFSKVFVIWGNGLPGSEYFAIDSMTSPIRFTTVPKDFTYPPKKPE